MSDTPQNLGVSLVDSQGQLLAELLADNTYQLTPIKGEAYKILNAEGGTTKLADNLIALRSGNDLIIRFANGLEVVMLDYFEICLQPAQDSDNPEAEAQLDCSITVAGDTKEGMTIGSGPASQYELASDASPRIVYVHGDDTALASIIGDNAGMEDIYAAYILSSTAPAVAAATAVSPTLLGAAGLGMNAAAGNGSEVSLAQLQLLEIGNISASNLSQVQAAIAATADDGTGVDSYAELRVLVNTPAETLTLRHPTSYTTQLKLINPLITQEGKLYYYYDVSADGTTGGTDTVTHNVLDSWFNGANTVDTQQAGTIAGIDDARTMIIDGYTIVLPTKSELEVIENQALSVGEMGWYANGYYWTSTLGTAANAHYYVYLDSTNGPSSYADTNNARVVFQVLQNTVVEGTENDDTVTGTANSEVLKGLAGNDHIHANGGTDMIDAGAGDDHIYINADNISRLDDAIVDGGAGTDTLHLIGESLNLDFTDLNNQHVVNIEVIDITGSGDNTLEIKASDVLDMSSTTDILKVIANAGDTVKATDMHDTGMVRTENGVTYKIYAEAGVDIQLWIDENATVVL